MAHRTASPERPGRRVCLQALAGACLPAIAWAQPRAPSALSEGDPLGSIAWPALRREVVGAATVRFDERVVVIAPRRADDPAQVPVTVVADGLPGVDRIVIAVDRNPVRRVIDWQPGSTWLPRISLRLRLEEPSVVRALVRTRDGSWWAGGTWVDTPGGGMTQAGRDHPVTPTIGGRLFDTAPALQMPGQVRRAAARLRLSIDHPMDSGLVSGAESRRLQRLALSDPLGHPLGQALLHEGLSEGPLLSLDFATPPLGRFVVTATASGGTSWRHSVGMNRPGSRDPDADQRPVTPRPPLPTPNGLASEADARDYRDWITGLLDDSAHAGLDANEVLRWPVPERWRALPGFDNTLATTVLWHYGAAEARAISSPR
jgi:sulfur-oxidizing protein SoxY